MKKEQNADVFRSIKRLNEAVHRQQGIMSPDSNGKGHGRLLKTISENEGISGVELSLKMDMAAPVVSEKLSGLEKDGLIYRERDPSDRRRTHIYITNEGTMALARREFGKERFEDTIRHCLNEEEQKQFCDMCSRIIETIKDMENHDIYSNDEVINFYEERKERKKRRKTEKEEDISS